jgi:hypothetical protein
MAKIEKWLSPADQTSYHLSLFSINQACLDYLKMKRREGRGSKSSANDDNWRRMVTAAGKKRRRRALWVRLLLDVSGGAPLT